jgi:hypothetical protein
LPFVVTCNEAVPLGGNRIASRETVEKFLPSFVRAQKFQNWGASSATIVPCQGNDGSKAVFGETIRDRRCS